MATKEFIVPNRGEIPPFLAPLLTEICGESKLGTLSAEGVHIRVNVKSPWPKEKKVKPTVDETTLARLRDLTSKPEALEQEIERFSGPQLLQIAKMAGIHLSKGTKITSLRAQLSNSLRSDSVWRGISGGGAPSPPDGLREQ
jgi:hypothetical protein